MHKLDSNNPVRACWLPVVVVVVVAAAAGAFFFLVPCV
jgi:hypothetical protein